MFSVHPYIVRFSYFRFLQYHFMLPQTFLKNFIKWVVSFRSYSNFKMPSLASGWSDTFLASSLELLYVKWSDLTETFQYMFSSNKDSKTKLIALLLIGGDMFNYCMAWSDQTAQSWLIHDEVASLEAAR